MEAALDSQAVLAELTDDGTFDKLRQKALQGLRQHTGLREKAEELIQASDEWRDWQAQGGDTQDRVKKSLFAALRPNLQEKMLEEATRSMWEVLTAEGFGVTQEIEATVHEALCRAFEERQAGSTAQGQPQEIPRGQGGVLC